MISNILILGANYGIAGSKYGKPYDNTVGIPGIVGLIILIAFSFLSKSQLVEHYEKALGATHFGGRVMIIETKAALKLINKYF